MNIYAENGVIDIARNAGYNAYTASKTLDDVRQDATAYAEKIYRSLSRNNATSTKRYYNKVRDAYITGTIKALKAMKDEEKAS